MLFSGLFVQAMVMSGNFQIWIRTTNYLFNVGYNHPIINFSLNLYNNNKINKQWDACPLKRYWSQFQIVKVRGSEIIDKERVLNILWIRFENYVKMHLFGWRCNQSSYLPTCFKTVRHFWTKCDFWEWLYIFSIFLSQRYWEIWGISYISPHWSLGFHNKFAKRIFKLYISTPDFPSSKLGN